MQIHLVTLFPKVIEAVLDHSILKRAVQQGAVKFFVHDLRRWTSDQRKTVDDKPYGGGAGMVMMVEPFYKAVTQIKQQIGTEPKTKVVLTSAKGHSWQQKTAEVYSKLDALVVLCGHYEGVDERVAEHLVDEEISIGSFVLTGGELPALMIADSVVRLLPNVLGNEESLADESYGSKFIHEYPQYTRPANFVTSEGTSWNVPDILLSGDHQKINEWKQKQSK